MRIDQVAVTNIAGLADCDIDLTKEQVVALAGPNGAGKSKLLICLLAPWLRDLPASRLKDQVASATVRLSFSDAEVEAFQRFSDEMTWMEQAPSTIDITVARQPTAGIRVETSPHNNSVETGLVNPDFLEKIPSVDVLYLPAERRFSSPSEDAVRLSLLDPSVSTRIASETRYEAFRSAGQLDDAEFEAYAKALCMANFLPENTTDGVVDGEYDVGLGWNEFKAAVDRLIDPKELLALSRDHPSVLRVLLPDGTTHPVAELSSGERQALTIVSRIFRAGETETLTVIDEPDLHLHPHLGSHLFDLIKPRGEAQLFIATHSAAILDNVSTESVWEIRHDEEPVALLSEADRIAMYRSAGFKASELTQSDLLVLTEGKLDADLLRRLDSRLTRSSMRSAGGRREVVKGLETLLPYELPVLGVVDGDILADAPDRSIRESLTIWPTADIEALFLSDRSVLDAMISADLMRAGVTVDDLQMRLIELAAERKDNVVAEVAQRMLRLSTFDWPSPKGDHAIDRLIEAVEKARPLDRAAAEEAVEKAQALIEAAASPWEYLRGKYVLSQFVEELSIARSGEAFLVAVSTALDVIPEGARGFVDQVDNILKH